MAVAVVAMLAPSTGQAQVFRFLLRADPNIIVADGRSTATISVEVNAAPGADVSDGTEVRFSTTLGAVTESARLMNGTARATLRSHTESGVATVTAIIGVSREHAEVEFLPVGATPSRDSRLLAISGEYLEYSVDRNVARITGKGSVRVRDLTIESDVKMTVHLGQERVLAEGVTGESTVSISNGVETVRGDRLAYEVRSRRGQVARVSPRPTRIRIHGDDLETDEEAPIDESLWMPMPTTDTQTWIIARRMTVFPQEKIQFHHASLYVNGVHVVTLPIHILSLNSYTRQQGVSGLFGDRSIGFNSTGGFSLDVPFYYRANTRGTGAVRLRRTGGSGFYTERPGWSLALEEQYTVGNNGEGVVMLDQIPRSDWGISLQHEHTFSTDERGFVFLDFPRHRDLFGRMSYYKRFENHNFGVELFGTLPKVGRGTGSSQAYWQLDPKPLKGTTFTYTVTGDLSLSRNVFGTGNTRFSQAVDVRVYPRPLRLDRRTSVVSSVELGTYHDNTSRFDANVGGNVSLRYGLGGTGSMTLGYTYDPGSSSFAGAGTNEYLSLNLYASRGWRSFASVYATQSLKQDALFGFGSVAYRLDPKWYTSLDVSYQDFIGTSFTDYEIALGRSIGSLEARLAYAKSRSKLFLELGTSMY